MTTCPLLRDQNVYTYIIKIIYEWMKLSEGDSMYCKYLYISLHGVDLVTLVTFFCLLLMAEFVRLHITQQNPVSSNMIGQIK